MLTNKKIKINDGKIASLNLGPKETIVLSQLGKSATGKVVVRVQLNGIETQPGEVVAIIGDCVELGNWCTGLSQPLEYINENTWFTELVFNESAGQLIAYKYVILDNEKLIPVRENCTTRKRLLIDRGVTKWRDQWENS